MNRKRMVLALAAVLVLASRRLPSNRSLTNPPCKQGYDSVLIARRTFFTAVASLGEIVCCPAIGFGGGPYEE